MRQRLLTWQRLGLLATGLAVCILGGCSARYNPSSPAVTSAPIMSPTATPTTTTTTNPSPGQTVSIGIPDKLTPDQIGQTVAVTIPDSTFEKLTEIWQPGVLEIIWPAIAALAGAAIGGGATIWVNRQNNSAQLATAAGSRRTQIKDRTFSACVDVLKTAQLYYSEANGQWWDLRNREPPAVIEGRSPAWEEALRNHYAAVAVARMAMPPTLKPLFTDYVKAARNVPDLVAEWKVAYLNGQPFFDSGTFATPEDRYADLQRDMVAKRDAFADAAEALFAEGVWS